MPYKIETDHINLPKKKWFDRRYKLTDQERDEIRENIEWLSQRKLAAKYKVSRRLISFIQDPDKYEIAKAQRRDRAKDWRYYDKEYHREAIKDTRRYRYKILNNNHKTKWQ